MFRKTIFIVIIFALTAISSCKNGSDKNSKSSTETPPSKLEIPEVPISINDQIAKTEYLLTYFWQNYNFGDTSLLENSNYTETPLFYYLSIVKKYNSPAIHNIYSSFLDALILSHPKVREKFLNLIEYNYYHPNSQIRDEQLYSVLVEKVILNKSFAKPEVERYLFQKRIISQNMPGNRANLFSIQTKDGNRIAVDNIKSKYLVLIFFDPECEHCISTIESMKVSPIFKSEKVKVVAIMPENNKIKFIDGANKLPSDWISGFDYKDDIMNKLLYDLRPSPSLYLLDENKRVILKDGYLHEIEGYLAERI